jgi:hypothetical protein
MVRTETVKLTSIKGIAYKQKLTAGGAGIVILTPGDRAAFTINKRDGSSAPYGKVDTSAFSEAVVKEAIDLTKGLPFRRLGTITKVYDDTHCDETSADEETEDIKAEIDVMASTEYKEFVAQYTDKNGSFSYQLMNKDLMQFSAKSSVVQKMLAEKASVESIVKYVVKSKAADLSRNKGMDDEMLDAFIDMLDSMNTRSAFKELRAFLRGKMSRKKA